MRAALSLLTGLLVSISCTSFSYASDSDPKGIVADASVSAKAWLTVMDRKEYTSSYNSGGTVLHEQISLDHWNGALNAIRANFGTVVTRELTGHNYFPQGFGSKDGEFVELDFSTKFSLMTLTYTETLIMHREGGTWVTAGYSLNPPPLTPEQLAAQPNVEEDEPQETHMNAANAVKPVKITRQGNNSGPIAPSSVESSSSDPLPK